MRRIVPARGILRVAAPPLALFALGLCALLRDEDRIPAIPDNPEPQHQLHLRPQTTARSASTKSLAEVASAAASDHVLLFNRVPGSGGEAFVLMLQKLQGGRFRHVRFAQRGAEDGPRMSEQRQKQFVREIDDAVRAQAIPLSFDKIVYFTNFSEFGVQSPTYFSVIRDPMENAIARLASLSSKTRLADGDTKEPSAKKFADCWLSGAEPECSLVDDEVPRDFAVPYFCGHDERCAKFNDDDALNKAKDMVDRHYPVLGLLERPNETLFMLENKLPLFFAGAAELYFAKISEKQKRWIGRERTMESIANDAAALRRILRTECEFYDWAKARLLTQAETLVPKSTQYHEKYYNHLGDANF